MIKSELCNPHHNTKSTMVTKPIQCWTFTINNPDDDDDPRKWEDARYVSWQLEEGDGGTKHYQGYVEFKKQKRLSGVKKVNGRAHWEPRRGTPEQAIAYTQKEETRLDGPWEIGSKGKGSGHRSDLDEVGEEIKAGASMAEVANAHPGLYIQYGRGFHELAQVVQGAYGHDDVRGVWYWGKPGTGKSWTARKEHPDAYLKAQNKWWDNYQGQDAVILDDLDKLGGDKLGHHLKIWGDRYFPKT